MAKSNWNELLDQLLASKLTANEYRLGLALARLLLGWKRTGAHLGRALVRETAGNMDGRSFERALLGLVDKGLVRFTPGGIGKGNRGHYELVLEKAAPARPFEEMEKAAPARPNRSGPKKPLSDTQKAAPARPRRVRGRGKTSRATPELQQLIAKAIDAYRNHGGSLELADRKPALVGQVATLARNGTDERVILAACADLGRARAFPGLLKQRVDQITSEGGPCQWQHNRRGLTRTQLLECGCPTCTQWAEASPEKSAETPTL
jgi:hypothetical protein